MTRTRVALVTGASSGIGKASAIALAAAGFKVFAGARRVDEMQDLLPHGCFPIALDVTQEDSVKAAVAAAEQVHGAVDLLVNNAAFGRLGPLEEFPLETMRRQFETNLFGGVRLVQLVAPGMRRQGSGRIINISSVGGEHTTPLFGSYHATKYATEVVSDTLRFELAPFGIEVVVVQPGAVRTPMAEGAMGEFVAPDESPYAPLVRKFGAMARDSFGKGRGLVEPSEVAATIVKAATATRPATRYVIGAFSSRLLPVLKRWLPDRTFDRFWRMTLGL